MSALAIRYDFSINDGYRGQASAEVLPDGLRLSDDQVKMLERMQHMAAQAQAALTSTGSDAQISGIKMAGAVNALKNSVTNLQTAIASGTAGQQKAAGQSVLDAATQLQQILESVRAANPNAPIPDSLKAMSASMAGLQGMLSQKMQPGQISRQATLRSDVSELAATRILAAIKTMMADKNQPQSVREALAAVSKVLDTQQKTTGQPLTVKDIVGALAGKGQEPVNAVVQALAAAKQPAAIQAVVATLADGRPQMAIQATLAVGQVNQSYAAQALTHVATVNPQVAAQIVQAVAAAQPVVVQIMAQTAIQAEQPALVAMALTALTEAKQLPAATQALQAVVTTLAEAPPHLTAQVAVALAQSTQPAATVALQTVAATLAETSPQVAAQVAVALSQNNQPAAIQALQTIAATFAEAPPNVAAQIAVAQAQNNQPGATLALQTVASALATGSPQAVAQVMVALAQPGQPTAAAQALVAMALAQISQPTGSQPSSIALANASPQVIGLVAAALAQANQVTNTAQTNQQTPATAQSLQVLASTYAEMPPAALAQVAQTLAQNTQPAAPQAQQTVIAALIEKSPQAAAQTIATLAMSDPMAAQQILAQIAAVNQLAAAQIMAAAAMNGTTLTAAQSTAFMPLITQDRFSDNQLGHVSHTTPIGEPAWRNTSVFQDNQPFRGENYATPSYQVLSFVSVAAVINTPPPVMTDAIKGTSEIFHTLTGKSTNPIIVDLGQSKQSETIERVSKSEIEVAKSPSRGESVPTAKAPENNNTGPSAETQTPQQRVMTINAELKELMTTDPNFRKSERYQELKQDLREAIEKLPLANQLGPCANCNGCGACNSGEMQAGKGQASPEVNKSQRPAASHALTSNVGSPAVQ